MVVCLNLSEMRNTYVLCIDCIYYRIYNSIPYCYFNHCCDIREPKKGKTKIVRPCFQGKIYNKKNNTQIEGVYYD